MGKHHHHGYCHHDITDDNLSKEKEYHFTLEEALQIGKYLCINFDTCGYDVQQYRTGLEVELEHGRQNAHTNVTNDDPIMTGKIALAHLNEFPDYYIRLTKMEKDAEAYWEMKRHHNCK